MHVCDVQLLIKLEDVHVQYASSDVNIVMMMFFELFLFRKSSQVGLELTTLTDHHEMYALTIELLGLKT